MYCSIQLTFILIIMLCQLIKILLINGMLIIRLNIMVVNIKMFIRMLVYMCVHIKLILCVMQWQIVTVDK